MSKRLVFRCSPELADGQSHMICEEIEDLLTAVREWAENRTQPGDEGEGFSVELVAMTQAEIDRLPEL